MEQKQAAAPGRVRLFPAARTAMGFVVLLGIVSLLADATYEGARSINGQYLFVLGGSGAAVGFISGFGELANYGLRLFSGYVSDKTGKYWAMVWSGYVVNLLAVPLLALVGSWQLAGALMIAERMGKGVRSPPKSAMLSHATVEMGRGWGFGLHEAMDQTGAVIGPLSVAAVLYFRGQYEPAYALLIIPAVLALLSLSVANRLYPNPRDFEPLTKPIETSGFPRAFWIYMGAAALIALGFADFTLIAFRLEHAAVVSQGLVPVFYAVAMLAAGAAGFLSGRLFDQVGLKALIVGVLLSSAFAPLAFLGNGGLALLGIVLWAIGLGAHDTILSAALAEMVAPARRATAYGVYNAGFGLAWFAGSVILGVLYDVSIPALVAFAVVTQLAAIPLLVATIRAEQANAARA